MAYSTTKTLALTKAEIINSALRKIGEFDEGDTYTDAEEASATLSLNTIIAEWIGEGIGLWLRGDFILILFPGKQRYSLGPAGTAGTVDDFHAFLSTELNEATVTAEATAGAGTVTVDEWVDYAGQTGSTPASGDNMGITLSDGTIYWTTDAGSSGATTADPTAVIPTGLTAPVGAKVYTYTNRLERPHGLLSCHRTDTSGNTSEVELIGRTAYERLSLKGSDGSPVKAHFDPQLHSVTSASDFAWLHVWPVKNPTSLHKMVMVGEFYPDFFSATEDTNELRFPREWGSALIWALAMELGFEYEVVRELRVDISVIAKAKKDRLVEMSDIEDADVRFTIGVA